MPLPGAAACEQRELIEVALPRFVRGRAIVRSSSSSDPKNARSLCSLLPFLSQLDEVLPAGRHVTAWKGEDDGGRQVSSGVYFCRLEAGKDVQTRKLLLLK